MAALTNPHQSQDVGSLIIQSGSDIVCALNNATYTYTPTTDDVRGLCRPGARNQQTGAQGRLSIQPYFNGSNGFFLADYDLTAITFGGVTILPQLYTVTLNGTFDKQPLPAMGVFGAAQGVQGQNYDGTVELQIDDTDVVQALIIAAEGTDLAAKQMVFSMTFNGQPITFPVQLGTVTHVFNQGQYQKVTFTFSSQAPARGTAFPTAPTTLPGSPGLLDYALLSPKTNLSFVFTSKVTHGIVRSGLITQDGFTVTFSDSAVAVFNFNYATYGNVAVSNNGTGA